MDSYNVIKIKNKLCIPHPLLNFPEFYKIYSHRNTPGMLLRFPGTGYIIFVGSGVSDLIVPDGKSRHGYLGRHPHSSPSLVSVLLSNG